MAVSESILLRRFTQNKDTEAFSEIVKRYADPVYNTCRRILYDEAGAADAAQETFYQLMCNASSIKGSLAGWLHSVATHKSIEAIRRNSTRRSRERKYAFSKSREVNQWKDISPYIDQELEKLSMEHKSILMQYFFESKTMAEIATLNNVSQPTISRKISIAVEELGKRLRKKGIIVGAVVLGSLIENNTLYAAPAVLLTEVGKMSLVGTTTGMLTTSAVSSSAAIGATGGCGSLSVVSTGTVKSFLTAAFSTAKAKIAAAVTISAIGTGAVFTYNNFFSPEQEIADAPVTETVPVADQTADSFENVTPRSNQPMVLEVYNAMGMGGRSYGVEAADVTNSTGIPIILTDPEETINTFTELLITDNMSSWADCFTPDSESFVNLSRIMINPQTHAEHQLQNAFNSIGHPVETLELAETENGLAIKLMYTVYDSFTIEKDDETLTWQEGDQFEVNAELVLVDSEWKIDTIHTADSFPDFNTNSLQ